MTALSLALSLGFSLAFLAWRDWLKTKAIVPPHEELKAEVKALRQKVEAVEAWARR